MKRKAFLTLLMAISCLFLTAFPSFAGEWVEREEEQWQYIDDDGIILTGWLKLGEERFYLDDEGYRISGRWAKISRYWYYFDEDGVLATSMWVDNYHVDADGKKDKAR